MGTIDSVLNEAESTLGISRSKGAALLTGFLAFIQDQAGGLKEILDRFRRAGLGDSVSTWFSGGTKKMTPESVENVLGRDTIDRLASKAGLSAVAASSALALIIPRLVPQLAPGGAIPAHIPSDLLSDVDRFTRGSAPVSRQVVPAAVARPAGSSRFLWLLLGLIALLLIGMWAWTNRGVGSATIFNAEEQTRLASEKAMAAITALQPGFSMPQLVSALNLEVFNFPSGSAQIPDNSYDFLNKAAEEMKAAPANTVIQISGHTDNTGDSNANMQLSQQRADAVRDYLVRQGVNPSMLVTRAYGDTQPIASNTTDEGRFRNRRIEFSVPQ